MRSTGDRLENKFIVPIARELAIALKAIHDGGIIHRDVKGMGLSIFKLQYSRDEIIEQRRSMSADINRVNSCKYNAS